MSLSTSTVHVAEGTVVQPEHGEAGALRLDAVPGSVAHGRHWVVAQVEAVGASENAVMVAELLTSELVTNAVLHGPSAGVITVRAAVHGDAMNVTVSDQSHRCPVLCVPTLEDLGGRGMHLVQTLANAWGIELHDGDGKSIWFRVRLDASAA